MSLRSLAILNKEFEQIEDGLFLKTLNRILLQWASITIDLLLSWVSWATEISS